MGDYIGEHSGVIKGNARSVDYSSDEVEGVRCRVQISSIEFWYLGGGPDSARGKLTRGCVQLCPRSRFLLGGPSATYSVLLLARCA